MLTTKILKTLRIGRQHINLEITEYIAALFTYSHDKLLYQSEAVKLATCSKKTCQWLMQRIVATANASQPAFQTAFKCSKKQ